MADRRRSLRPLAVGIALTLAAVTTACSGGGGSARSSATPARTAADLTTSEIAYGVAPTTEGGVSYKPDVVLVKGGADMVRSVSPDGLTWTIDGQAGGIGDLAVGKVFFLSGRGVGRVLAIKDVGGDKAITLGPVDLTDVVQDAKVSYDKPLELGSLFSYSLPTQPGVSGAAPTLSGADQGGSDGSAPPTTARFAPPRFAPASAAPLPAGLRVPTQATGSGTASGGGPVASSGPAPAASAQGFTIQPYAGPSGLGLEIKYDENGVKFFGRAILRLAKPTLRFNLEISGGKVTVAEVQIGGAAGITFEFQSGSTVGIDGNLNRQVQVPVDLSFPLPILGLPLAITVRQQFILKTAFSAKDASMSATGSYGFGGTLSVGYRNGSFGVGAPTNLSTSQSILKSLNGVSIGVNGLVLAYQTKIIVGIGAFGFAAGPFFGLNTSFGITRGSDLGIVLCKGASLDISAVVGLGYSIPQPVTSAINSILRRLNLGQIKGSGGLEHRQNLIHKEGITPVAKICREGAGGAAG